MNIDTELIGMAITYLLIFVGGGIGIFVGYKLLGLFNVSIEAYKRKLIQMDAALVPFGNTIFGQTVNRYATAAIPKVDSPDDPLIQAAAHLPGLYQLYQAGFISPEDLSKLASGILQNAIKLTNGIPDVEFTVITPSPSR